MMIMMWFYVTHPAFMGLGWCPIVSWDFAGAVSIFGPDALSVIRQWLLLGIEPATSWVRVTAQALGHSSLLIYQNCNDMVNLLFIHFLL